MELYFKSREDWRLWLEENHLKNEGIWFIYYKKLSGKPTVSYNDAVEEALCFGWIDSKIKKIDEEYYIQWFTPRRKGSKWSDLNIKRVKKLLSEKKMKPAGLSAYDGVVQKPESLDKTRNLNTLPVPDDLNEALKNNSIAFENFMKFSSSSRRLYLGWLNDARRQETRLARIAKIVERSERNIKPGMM